MIAASIVSHGHGHMVERIVERLLTFEMVSTIVITKNISEDLIFPNSTKIIIIENAYPKGYSENHNYSFSQISENYFCVLNPDIDFFDDPFPILLNNLKKFNAALIAPLIINSSGELEDSVRYFPTIKSLFLKLFFKISGAYDINFKTKNFYPEWVAGMFMLFESKNYLKVNGFDEKYFLYYEDVDICVRLWNHGYKILFCPSVIVVHDARRSSRSNSTFFRWHINSLIRYLTRHSFRLPRTLK